MKTRIRVMMIGPYPQSSERIDGGVASAITYLSQALSKDAGIDLIGVRVGKGTSRESSTNEFAWPIAELPLGSMSLSMLYLRQKRRFAQLVAEFRPDLVHAHGVDVAGYVAVSSGVPCVVTIHGLLADCARFQTDVKSRLRATVAAYVTEKHTVKRSKYLIAISPYVTKYYAGDISGEVFHVANPVSPSFFELDRKPEQGRLLYAGRISNGKGIPELLEAVALSGEHVSEVVLAGATPDLRYRASLVNQVARLGLMERVRFTGLLGEAELLDEFRRASALVLPSHQETAPMVVQQAMAAGLPVIATRVGGIPDQVEDGRTGWLFSPGDVQRLSIIIRRIASDPASGSDVAANARKVAQQRYHSDAVAKATFEVYEKVLVTSHQASV